MEKDRKGLQSVDMGSGGGGEAPQPNKGRNGGSGRRPVGRWVLLGLLLLALLSFTYIYFILPGSLPWNDSEPDRWYGDSLEYLDAGFGLSMGNLGQLGEYRDLGLPSWGDDDVFAVLIMGFDYDYPGIIRQGGGVPGRTDAIMLLVVPKDHNAATLVSIPRDTLVPLDSYGTEERINAVYRGISLQGTINAVTFLTGVEADKWVSLDFNGFVQIMDRLGGVDIEVEDYMTIWDDLNGRWVYIEKGPQHLDGHMALLYVRFRGDQMGDISRNSRQLRFIKALAGKAVEWNTVGEIGGIISDLQENVKTDMSYNEVLALGMRLLKIGTSRLDGFSIPGVFEGPYWRADLAATRKLMERAITGAPLVEDVVEENVGLEEVAPAQEP